MAASENIVDTSQSAGATGLRCRMQSAARDHRDDGEDVEDDCGHLLAPRIGGVPERRHRMGLRLEPLQVVHEAAPAVLGVLEVHAHVDRLLGADLLAVAAEDAAELVDLVDQRVAVALLVLARAPA